MKQRRNYPGHRPTLRALGLTLLLLVPGYLAAGEFEFFAARRNDVNPHAALLRAPSINVLYCSSTLDKRHYMIFDMGANFPVISYRTGDLSIDLGGGGGAYSRFELFSESFNFVHADFNGGIFADIRWNRLLLQTVVSHTSSHIGDDTINYHRTAVKNTGFESVKQYAILVLPLAELSLGAEYPFSYRPRQTMRRFGSVLLGARLNLLSEGIPLFMEWEAEIIIGRYPPNFGIRLGVYLRHLGRMVQGKEGDGAAEPHEFSIFYYNGYSKMGYFSNEREQLILAGPSFRY